MLVDTRSILGRRKTHNGVEADAINSYHSLSSYLSDHNSDQENADCRDFLSVFQNI